MRIAQAFNNFFYAKFQSNHDVESYSQLLSIYIMAIFSFLPHIFFACYFWWLGINFLVLTNLISCIVYCLILFLLKNNRYSSAIFWVTMEVALSALVTVPLLGSYTNMQWFVLSALIPQYLFFKMSNKKRLIITFYLSVIFAFLSFSEYFIPPLFPQPDNWILRMFNTGIVLLAILIELTMDKTVKSIIHRMQQKNIDQLQEQAYLDPLTGLLNRRYADIYFETLKKQLHNGPICFISVDIDDFKHINDTLGHAAGDQILIRLSDIFKSSLRQTDLIFRWGGEEFLVIAHHIDLNSAFYVMEDIRKKVEANCETINGQSVRFTFTAGIAELKSDDINAALAHCDRNLYRGKNSGKNRVVI